MTYKYKKNEGHAETPKPHETDARITEEKEVSKPRPLTEEETQQETVKDNQDKFFDEDDEIIEVNFD